MVIDILRDEENHLRTFERYLTESSDARRIGTLRGCSATAGTAAGGGAGTAKDGGAISR